MFCNRLAAIHGQYGRGCRSRVYLAVAVVVFADLDNQPIGAGVGQFLRNDLAAGIKRSLVSEAGSVDLDLNGL